MTMTSRPVAVPATCLNSERLLRVKTQSPQTYEACSNGVVTTQPWTGFGNPVNDDTATHYLLRRRESSVLQISSAQATDDDDLPTSCSYRLQPQQQRLAALSRTEPIEACSNGVLTTKPWTRSGNPVDDPTRRPATYCIGATPR